MTSEAVPTVRVGVAVIVWNDLGELLLGLRKGDHGGGTWSFPGGHVEHGERPIDTAKRELSEEIGPQCQFSYVRQYSQHPYTSTVFASGKHYITLIFEAVLSSGQPLVMEPDKCAEWKWFPPNGLPTPLFEPLDNWLRPR